MRGPLKLIGALAAIVTLVPPFVDAQWSHNPSNPIYLGGGFDPDIVSDSAGGCYISYVVDNAPPNYLHHILIDHLNKWGERTWTAPKQLPGMYPEQWYASLISDGRGGAIAVYMEDTLLDPLPPIYTRLRAIRIDSLGNFVWDSNGVRIDLSERSQGNQVVVPDGTGGCICAWTDSSDTPEYLDEIRVQRISSSGVRMWGDSGKYIATNQYGVLALCEGPITDGGAIIEWYDGMDYRLQLIDNLGHFLWNGSNGVIISVGATKLLPGTEGNGETMSLGGQYLGSPGGTSLFTFSLQKIDSLGTILWDSMGVIIDTLHTNLSVYSDLTSQVGVSTVVWQNPKSGVTDLYYQLVRANGTEVLAYPGLRLSDDQSNKISRGVLPSISGSIVLWQESGGAFAQRVDSSGNRLWSNNGMAVVQKNINDCKSTVDGSGGIIAVIDLLGIEVQQISRNGNLGEVITGIENSSGKHGLPYTMTLDRNYPNPFNPSTTISYSVPELSHVRIDIYDVLGRLIAVLLDKNIGPGAANVTWNGRDKNNREVGTGVYFCRMTAIPKDRKDISLQVRKLLKVQ
jgi:hypothetical protein